jgi:hypothetical protein
MAWVNEKIRKYCDKYLVGVTGGVSGQCFGHITSMNVPIIHTNSARQKDINFLLDHVYADDSDGEGDC